MTKRITKEQKTMYAALYQENGEEGIYKKAVGAAVFAINKDSTSADKIEIDLLDSSDGFLAIYRASGEEIFLNVSRALRKAAHKLNRMLNKKIKNRTANNRILRLIPGGIK